MMRRIEWSVVGFAESGSDFEMPELWFVDFEMRLLVDFEMWLDYFDWKQKETL